MSDLKKYWYVGKNNVHIIENNMSCLIGYGDLIEGREDGDTLVVFSVDGNQVYGVVTLPIDLFHAVDYNAAYLIEETDDVDKD